MNLTVCRGQRRLRLAVFDPLCAAQIAQWVETPEQLRWVAPSTQLPLTPAKVAGWKKPEGQAFLLRHEGDARPVGYGELNPMRAAPEHPWLGHVIVRPDQRGLGIGQALVRALVEHACDRLFARAVSLIVCPDNSAAIECYRRVGFAITGEEHHRFGASGPRHRFLRLDIEPGMVNSE